MVNKTPPQPLIYDPLLLPKALDFTAAILRRKGDTLPVFRMEDRLVWAYHWEQPSDEMFEDSDLRRDDGALMVGDVTETKLLEFMTEHVPFGRVVSNNGTTTLIPVPPPSRLPEHFMAAPDRWRFPVLKGLIQAPTLRDDGSLLATPGYDQTSGLYLDLNGVEYPPLKDRPTRADALAALAILREPFEEFPFVTDDAEDFEGDKSASRSVALSAILTGMIRRTLPAAPLHGFDAPDAGSGKGLCCNIVATIVTGTRASMMNFATTDTEFRKALFAALLANDLVITLDNIAPGRMLDGDTLNTALTERTMHDRLLGHSKLVTVPTNALFMANGNNLGVKGDMQRRIIAGRIEAGENPERRNFKRPNLLQWVADNRPRLVAAALTVLRAYQIAPDADKATATARMTAYGSYEEWSARVRAALIWLGEADPVATNARFKEADPEREALGLMLRGLQAQFGTEWFKAKAVAALAEADADLTEGVQAAAISWDARSIGNYLAKIQGKTVDRLRIAMGEDRKAKVKQFRVVDAG